MRVLQTAESPQFGGHLVTFIDLNVDIVEDATPDFADFCVLFPLLETRRQQVKAFALLAQDPTERFLDARPVLILRLLVHFGYLGVSQAILFHHSDQNKVVLTQLPGFQVRGAVFVFVLSMDLPLQSVVLPRQKVAPDVRH